MRLTLTLAACALVAGCTNVRCATRGIHDSAKMVETIRARVTVGSSFDDAQRFMQGEGFSCRHIANGSWGDCQGIDYLYCDRSEAAGGLVARRWQVAIIHQGGKV